MTLAKTANQSTVTVSGHKVEMHKGGSGPALLFLHGGGGFGTFDPTNSALSERFTVYAPSHPGSLAQNDLIGFTPSTTSPIFTKI